MKKSILTIILIVFVCFANYTDAYLFGNPTGNNDYFTMVKNDTLAPAVSVLDNDTDPDGQSDLRVNINPLELPKHGEFTFTSIKGDFIYIPDVNYVGIDSIYYKLYNKVTDHCTEAYVIITVNPVNNAPVANPDNVATDEDTDILIDVKDNDTDIDGDDLNVTIVPGKEPQHGDVIVNANGTVTYTPDENYYGTDNFIYELCDNVSPSKCDTAIVNITVKPVNDAPDANPDTATTVKNNPVKIDVKKNDTDIDGDNLNVSIVEGKEPQHGEVVVNADGTVTYTPDNNYSGTDKFTYKVCDDGVPSKCDTASVTIKINAFNTAPVANPDNAITSINKPVKIDVKENDTDIDGDELNVSILTGSGPQHGEVVVNADGTVTYTPENNYIGTDEFQYILCDDGTPSGCDTSVVTITVNPENNPPVANPDTIINTGSPAIIIIGSIAYDPDGDNLTLTIKTEPANGSVEVNNDGNIVYHPEANPCGIDSFIYEVCDPMGLCASNVIYIITYVPTDSDGDGIPDYFETIGADTDDDGIPDYLDTDSDNDGIPDSVEGKGDLSDPCNIKIADTDNDGIPDYRDLDSDNDGIPDEIEGVGDCDKDEIPNYRDVDPCDIHVPEGFSPNGDEFNQYFEINGLENYPKNSIVIFNRWGNVVYKADPYNNDWDGTCDGNLSLGGGKAPAGTYFYSLDLGNGSKPITGFVYLAE